MVTTLLARRAQFHQSVLATHITSGSYSFRAALTGATHRLMEQGYSAPDAALRAMARVSAVVEQQANSLAFFDCFWLLGLIAFLGPVLAIFIRKFDQGGKPPAH